MTNFKANIYRKTKTGYLLVKSVGFKPDDRVIPYKSHKNRSYLVNMGAISHEDNKTKYLCFDYDNGNILSFNEVESTLSPDDTDALVFHNIVGTLLARVFQGLTGTDKGRFLGLVFAFIIGLVIGYLACNSMTASQVAQQAQGVASTVAQRGLAHVSALLL